MAYSIGKGFKKSRATQDYIIYDDKTRKGVFIRAKSKESAQNKAVKLFGKNGRAKTSNSFGEF